MLTLPVTPMPLMPTNPPHLTQHNVTKIKHLPNIIRNKIDKFINTKPTQIHWYNNIINCKYIYDIFCRLTNIEKVINNIENYLMILLNKEINLLIGLILSMIVLLYSWKVMLGGDRDGLGSLISLWGSWRRSLIRCRRRWWGRSILGLLSCGIKWDLIRRFSK